MMSDPILFFKYIYRFFFLLNFTCNYNQTTKCDKIVLIMPKSQATGTRPVKVEFKSSTYCVIFSVHHILCVAGNRVASDMNIPKLMRVRV